jgi:hypothetical protein
VYNFQTVYKHYLPETKQERNSVPDNFNSSYIESAIISLFRIDILNYIKIKASFAKEFHIAPSELDNMPVWEYELFLKEINNMVKEENEKHQKEMDNNKYKDMQKMSDPKYAQRMSSKYTDGIKMPNISMPKL